MAAQHESGTQHDQQTQNGRGAKGASGATGASQQHNTQSGAQGGAHTETQTGAQNSAALNTSSGTHGAPQADQERPMPTSREQGAQQSGQALSQRGQQQGQGGLARQQPSVLPAMFAAPPGLMASAFLTDPVEFMNRLSGDLDNWFSGMGQGASADTSGGRGLATRGRSWMPNIETFQRGNDLIVRADVPGIPKQDLDINVNDGVLTISGERQSAQGQERGQNQQNQQNQQSQNPQRQSQQHQSQSLQGGQGSARSAMSFYEAIELPEGVNEDQISATCENGVLEITIPLPQQQQRKGRKVQVQ